MAPISRVLTVLILALAASAAPSKRAGGKTHNAPDYIPSIWKALGNAVGTAPLTFNLHLVPASGSESALDAKIQELATSRSGWLTSDQLAQYTRPSADATNAVLAAVKAMGGFVVETSPSGDVVTVKSTVAQAASFFGASFTNYGLQGIDGQTIKTKQYTIPAAISDFVADVSPIATFGSVKRAGKIYSERDIAALEVDSILEKRAAPAQCNTASTTSSCYRALYQYDSYQPTTKTGPARTGILGFISQNFSPTDLATWISKYRPDAKGYNIPVNTSNGAINLPLVPGIEAALDTQTIAGIQYPLPSTFYDIGTQLTQGDIFLLAFQNFLNMKDSDRPTVLSISYGSEEQGFTSDQANTMCNAAKRLSALGVTIAVSSGDSGVDGNGQNTDTCPPFIPTYPGGCPYILSVGATQNFSPEVMVDTTLAGFYSGAGFSKIFPTPSYQSTVVPAYEAGAGAAVPAADYNKGGRAFPDISAQGSNQPVVVLGATQSVGGTSASAPIIAGGIALLNDLLIKAGKPTVGWAQPTLYSAKAINATTDVTKGGSYGCGTGTAPTNGLPAGVSWDASSGLGTPLFKNLRAVYGV